MAKKSQNEIFSLLRPTTSKTEDLRFRIFFLISKSEIVSQRGSRSDKAEIFILTFSRDISEMVDYRPDNSVLFSSELPGW